MREAGVFCVHADGGISAKQMASVLEALEGRLEALNVNAITHVGIGALRPTGGSTGGRGEAAWDSASLGQRRAMLEALMEIKKEPREKADAISRG